MYFIHKIFERSLAEAELGDAASQYRLGKLYEYGIVPSQDCSETVTWYLKAARQGHTDAQYRIGLFFLRGKGLSRNYSKAVKWLRRAAEKGHTKAESLLGFCYSRGKGVERDAEKAAKLLTCAADKGDIMALFYLGVCYADGEGVEQSASKAVKCFGKVREMIAADSIPEKKIKWLHHLAKAGNPEAQYCLGVGGYRRDVKTGKKHKVNQFEHKYFPRLREEAMWGDAEALFQLAECYSKRKRDRKSAGKALMLYMLAARQGHAWAQINLAERYKTGSGIPINTEMALMWYTQAVSQGDPDVLEVLYSENLEDLYDANKIFPINLERLIKCAELGNIRAQYELCKIYEKGGVVPADDKKALEWYRILSERENIEKARLFEHFANGTWGPLEKASILIKLGLFHLQGRGTEQNAEEAVRWFSKAAELESARAQYELGMCYFKGLGVPQDKTKAFALFQQAAYTGHKAAQYQVARCYHTGEGTVQNIVYARRWYGEVCCGKTSYYPYKTDPSKSKEFLPAKYYSAACYNKDSRYIDSMAPAAEPATNDVGEDAQTLFNLGLSHYCGDSAPRNVPEAVKQWLRAVDLGYAPAQYMLGLCYEYGVCAGNSIRRVRRFLGLSRRKKADAGKDIERALVLYEQAAEQGYMPAQYQLGCYYEGRQSGEDISLKWYHKAAEQGYAPAQYHLGSYYGFAHQGRDEDPSLSLEWHQKAAEQGFPYAQGKLFYSYRLKDPNQALQWQRRAAENGDGYAQMELAEAYCSGRHPYSSESVEIPVKQDYEEGLKWLRKLAVRKDCSYLSLQGDIPKAQIMLGELYYFGKGVEQNYAEAAKWFELAMHSPEDYSAGLELGLCYLFGDGVDMNEEYAADCIRRNTSMWGREKDGNGAAQYLLGCLYLASVGKYQAYLSDNIYSRGRHLIYRAAWYEGVPEAHYRYGRLNLRNNAREAVKTFGNTSYEPAMYQLGVCYQNGCGVEKDEKKAVDLYRKTAETGYAPAVYSLGDCYFYGIGVEMDQKKAVQYYRKASGMGHIEAILALGICYYEACGIRKNIEKGVNLFRRAARRGLDAAYYCLGYCYCQGVGLPLNPELGIKLYKIAAKTNSIVMYYLGQVYEEGYYPAGIVPDISKAMKLYRKAARHGSPDAQEKLKKLDEDSSDDNNPTDEDDEDKPGT